MKSLGIDLGASEIKIAGSVSNGIKVGQVKSLFSTYGTDNKNTVVLNNKKYHFGIGDPLITRDKTKRQLLKESILLSYYKIYGKTAEEEEVNIAIGIPINLFLADAKRKAFEDEVNKLKNVILDGTVNSESVCIKIINIIVCAEGYSAANSLIEDLDNKNNNIVIDIGYKTTDVIALAIVDSDWVVNANFTIDKGMWDVFTELKNILLSLDVDLSQETIQQRIINDSTSTIIAKNKKINLKELLLECTSVIDYIFNQIDLQIDDFYTSTIYLIGGGAIFTNMILNNKYSNINLIKDNKKSMYANAIGYLQQL